MACQSPLLAVTPNFTCSSLGLPFLSFGVGTTARPSLLLQGFNQLGRHFYDCFLQPLMLSTQKPTKPAWPLSHLRHRVPGWSSPSDPALLVTSATKISYRTSHCAVTPAWSTTSSPTPGQEPRSPEASQPPSSCSLPHNVASIIRPTSLLPAQLGPHPLAPGHLTPLAGFPVPIPSTKDINLPKTPKCSS